MTGEIIRIWDCPECGQDIPLTRKDFTTGPLSAAVMCDACGTWIAVEHVGTIPPAYPELMEAP